MCNEINLEIPLKSLEPGNCSRKLIEIRCDGKPGEKNLTFYFALKN